MGFAVGGLTGTELAKSDSLAVVGPTSTSINKGWVETMHVEVLIVDKEAFSDSCITVIKCMDVKSNEEQHHNEISMLSIKMEENAFDCSDKSFHLI